MDFIKRASRFILDALMSTWVFRLLRGLYKNPIYLILVIAVVGLSYNQMRMYYGMFMEEYTRLNSEKEEKADDPKNHLKFTKVDDFLYTLTGSVGEGDCDKIAPRMPDNFTLILESPGGNLAEGSCLAAHIKLRNVVTVVRDTPVMNAEGEVVYTPGQVGEELDIDHLKEKTVCASACGLMFLGGDRRYLIGNVWFGIHGPGTPDEFIGRMHPRQAESSAYRTAANLLGLLESLGVEDPDVRILFVQIPNQTMYWLHPRDFEAKPNIIKLATNYVNFWGLTTAALDPV
jgi:hypothetical protein